jgi:hypothetical protein
VADAVIVVNDPNKPISVLSSGSKTTQVVTAGTRGPRGPEGKSSYEVWLQEGNVGNIDDYFASLSGGDYTHDQMVPSDVWTIVHNLKFFPNVMSFDSAGTQIIGEVNHVDKNTVIITFSHSNAGKAYLS